MISDDPSHGNARGGGASIHDGALEARLPRRHPAERKVVLAFTISLLCLAAVGVVAHRSVSHLREDTAWVEHTHRVLNQFEMLESDIGDLQGALRGYALTGRDTDLTTASAAVDRISAAVERVQKLVTDNPEQARRFAALAEIARDYARLQRQVTQAAGTGGLDAARALILASNEAKLRGRVEELTNAMRETEHRLLADRQARARRSAAITDGVIIGGSVLALVLVAIAWIAIRRDFIGRRKAETELERFFTLSLDFLTIAGPDGYFKRVSHGVTEILGWTPDEFIRRPYLELVHPDDQTATLAEAARQVERGERVMHFENRYRHKDGSWRVLAWRSVPTDDGLMYGAARDVTEQRRIAEEIGRLNADLHERAEQVEAANRELEAFAYSVSHDLRTPLRHVQGYVELLERELDGKLDGDAGRFLATIGSSARKMSELIDQLLAFSKMSRVNLQSEAVDLQELIAEARQDLEMATRDRTIEWQIESLPRVRADRAMLKQALVNLLGNAVKYTRPRNPARIAIGAAGEEGRRVILFVRDNGVGFDMRHAERLFGVFQRLHRAKDFEGTGIGLANVHRIITRHGGRIWADAKPNEGATFYFTLLKA